MSWRRYIWGDIADIVTGNDRASKEAKQREAMFEATMYRSMGYENPNVQQGQYPPQGQMGYPGQAPQGQMGYPGQYPQGQMGYPGQYPQGGQMGYPGQAPQGQMGYPGQLPGMEYDPNEYTPAMAIKEAATYANEIDSRTGSSDSSQERVKLSVQVKKDLLTFLGYLYDPASADAVTQVNYTNIQLGMNLSTQDFFRYRSEHSMDPEVGKQVPQSLVSYVKDDKSGAARIPGSALSMSRFLVNTYRDLGIQFIGFGGYSEIKMNRLMNYIIMLNDYLKENGLYQTMDPYRRGEKGGPYYGLSGEF